MTEPSSSRWMRAWLEPLRVERARARAATLTDEARRRMKPWVSAARARQRVAVQLRAPEDRGVALALLREAVGLTLSALARVEAEAQAVPSFDWAHLDALSTADRAPSGTPRVRAAFADEDPLALEALSESEGEALRVVAERVLDWLLGLAEVRSPREITRARWIRSALALLAALLVLGALVSYLAALAALAPPAR